MRKHISFYIQNKKFDIISSATEEQIKSLAKMVDSSIKNLMSDSTMSFLEASVISNIICYDNLLKAHEEIEIFKKKGNTYSSNLLDLSENLANENSNLDELKDDYIKLCKEFDVYQEKINDFQSRIDKIAIELEKKSEEIDFMKNKMYYIKENDSKEEFNENKNNESDN